MILRPGRPSPILLLALALATASCQAPRRTTGTMVTGAGAGPALNATRPPRDTSQPNPVQPGDQTPATPGEAGSGDGPGPGTLPPTAVQTPPPRRGHGGDPAASLLQGFVTAPSQLLSNNGGSIISNNSSRLITDNGAGLIGNNGSALISNNGGSLITDNGAGYRLADAVGFGALTNAFIYLTDRDEKFFLKGGRVLATTVDAEGFYDFGDGFTPDAATIVNAVANNNLRLTGFITPGAERTNRLDVSLGSTLATEYLRGDAYRQGKSLKAYPYADFADAVAKTQAALASGAIAAVKDLVDQVGTTIQAGVFDLRADHTADLRNQYVVAFSAAPVADAARKAVSDAWTRLLGERPAAVTSVMGSGGMPDVVSTYDRFGELGFATGDQRGTVGGRPAFAPDFEPAKIPLGYNYGLATSARGDVFVGCFTRQGNTGHIRWVHPDGKIDSIWLPTYALGAPSGLVVERQPSETEIGTLLVADAASHTVFRIYLVNEAVFDDFGLNERYFMEVVAGEATPFYDAGSGFEFLAEFHPFFLEPDQRTAYVEPDTAGESGPLASRWRAADEGARTYFDGAADQANPQAGRWAHLDSPADVEVDELGNIYIADKGNHRVRFIPSQDALDGDADKNFFAYKTPTYDAGTQQITGLGAAPEMVAGAIYTIAGDPDWDPARTPRGTSRWFGAYGGDGGPAQRAKLDSPYALAFNRADHCLYVSDLDNGRVRKIDRETGVITTVAGNPPGGQRSNGQGDFDYAPGYSGDGGPATAAQLGFPRGLAFDARHRLLIADTNNGLIRLVDTDGTIRTVAGRYHDPAGVPTDNAGDGDARHYADLYETEKLDVDPDGNVLFNDFRHGRLRKLWRQWD